MGLRVLFFSPHSVRHLFPLATFAREVRRAGHSVGFLATPGMAGLLLGERADVLDLGPAGPGATVDDTAVRGCGLEHVDDAALWFAGDRIDRFLDLAVARASGWGPDLIVHEMHDLVGSATAGALGTPAATLATGPAITGPVAELMHRHLAERCARRGIPVPAAAPGYHPQGWYLDTCPASLQVEGWVPAQEVLPLRAGLYRGRPERRRRVEPVGRPQVLVTIGACAVAPRLLMPLLESIASLEVSVLALVGGEGVAVCRDDRITLVNGPLAELLGDAAAVVTRGCSGSAMAALHHGVPMVMIPQALDHVSQAERIAAAGAGISLPMDASPAAVTAAVRKALTSPSIIGSASRVADEIAALPEAAVVIAKLEARVR